MRYQCFIGAHTWSDLIATSCRHTLCLLNDCCSITFETMLNNSARLLNAVWCASFIVVNSACGVGFLNAVPKSHAASVAASAAETFGIITFEGENPRLQQLSLILFWSQKRCNTYSVPNLFQYTTPILHV